ncbi:MAG: GNAT family N-acetyltransferase, partial [Acidimicrobiia bacterium]
CPAAGGRGRGRARVHPARAPGPGLASNCVAAVSQLTLDRGASSCMLFTDTANLTSNAIYQRLGYRPVAGAREYRFSYP